MAMQTIPFQSIKRISHNHQLQILPYVIVQTPIYQYYI